MIKFVQVPCPSSCPSSGSSPRGEFSYPNIFFFWLSCYSTYPSRSAPIPGRPRFQAGLDSTAWPRAETQTWTRTWTRNLDKFYHVFSSCRATCPSSPGELGQGTWTTACRVTSSLSITPRSQAGPDSRQGPIPCASPRAEPELGQERTRNLDKFYHVFSSCRATCWTRNLDNCMLPCYKIPGASLASKPPCRTTCPASEPRQPAESYGSYGSYGHTVIRRLGTAPPPPGIGATPARRVIQITCFNVHKVDIKSYRFPGY